MGEAKEECGIAAACVPEKENAAYYLYKMLLQEQNRGQLSAGITTFNTSKKKLLSTLRETGLVNEVFKVQNTAAFNGTMKKFFGSKGIGHLRYSTFGGNKKAFAQPFERKHGRKWKWFSFCFNGNIANFSELKKDLEKNQYHFVLDNDTELMMHFLARGCRGDSRPKIVDVFSSLHPALDGAYSIAFVNAEGETVVARDHLGFKPLVIGKKDGVIAAASESASLESIGIEKFETVKPGALIEMHNGCIEKKWFCKSQRKAHCMFEWVYFANIASEIEGVNVYNARYALGEELAKIETEKISEEHIVVPVPDTAKPAADALAFSLGAPSREGIIRNRYVGRTFIEGDNRFEKAREKYGINKKVVSGKKVILVEDSIVRGTTTKAIVKYIKETGKAKEVHVRVSCPPIRFPCFYGIDMSTFGEFIAAPKKGIALENIQVELSESELEKIRQHMGADSLAYQPIEGLVKGIGLETGSSDLCMACLNGRYPTSFGEKLEKTAWENYSKGETKRAYE
ncbi:MAG: amidophosphoribosyltransferase [Candidatus ainarchaeum sp.]|nr:amidophosphoribosyltransferase [Candidatus ainarchaeum sp.]